MDTRAATAILGYSHVGLNQLWLCPRQQKYQVHEACHGSFPDPVNKEIEEGQSRTGIQALVPPNTSIGSCENRVYKPPMRGEKVLRHPVTTHKLGSKRPKHRESFRDYRNPTSV